MRISPLKLSLLLLVIALILWIAGSFTGVGACSVLYKTEEVNGNSLANFIEHGSKVRIAYGYYQCGELRRDDVVIYRDAGNANPLIKIVKGLSGDSFMLAHSEGGAKIFINGLALRTTTGEPYRISADAIQLLSLYERDYHGQIPAGAVLILGNIASGSRDSTEFGFVGRDNLIGKVVEVLSAKD